MGALFRRLAQGTSIQGLAVAAFAAAALWCGKIDGDTALSLFAASGILIGANEKREGGGDA